VNNKIYLIVKFKIILIVNAFILLFVG
jgi:hypothetical protein